MTLSVMPDRLAHVQGDESQGDPYTVAEEAFIAHRADELMEARLMNDGKAFDDLLSGINPSEINPHLQRAIRNLSAAIRKSSEVMDGVLTPVSFIARRLRLEAELVWRDECRREAEKQLNAEVQA